jgi:hypothetical protein
VLVALASKASAMPGWWPQPTATSSGEMRSGGNQMAAYGSQLGHLAAQRTDASIGAGFGAVLVPLLAGVSALLTDDGMSARFAAERRHDEGLVHRVESRRPSR